MSEINTTANLGLAEQKAKKSNSAREHNILRAIQMLLVEGNLPKDFIASKKIKDSLIALAEATEQELTSLARKSINDKTVMNNTEAKTSIKLGELSADQKIRHELDQGKYHKILLGYLDLRTKTQTLVAGKPL